MSMASATRPPASSPSPIRRITVDEYERINEAGALEDPSRVELIDGYMVEKMGFPVYWIINLVARQVEVFSRPGKNGYRSHQVFRSREQFPVTIGGQNLPPIPVESLLPRLKPTKGKGRPKGNGA
jgi:Uma2 family endonuclease